MIPSSSCDAESGEPSSYQQIEQALSKAASKPGEDTREVDSDSKELFVQGSKLQMQTNRNGLEPGKQLTNEETDCNGESAGQSGKQSVEHSLDRQIDHHISRKEAADTLSKTIKTPGDPDGLRVGSDLPISKDASTSRDSSRKHAAKNITEDPKLGSLTAASEPLKQDDWTKEPGHSVIASDDGSKPMFSFESMGASTSEIHGPPRVIHAQLPTGLSNSRASPNLNTGQGTRSKSSPSLRRGKWTMEEEAYVARVIQDFNSGFLNAPAGTTLRSYLSEKLQCDPMRITKKFTGDACIGKRVFHPAVRSAANASSIDKAQAELDALERRWRRRLEMQQRESAKKAAASAAAANPPGQGRGQALVQGVPLAILGGSGADVHSMPPTGDRLQQNAVAQAASWLDRANAILKGSKASVSAATAGESTRNPEYGAQSFDSMPSNEIENQMKEVQRLIYEGPIIKQTTAGLQVGSHHGASEPVRSDSSAAMDQGLSVEPADKRMRTAAHSGAEDAEALVGFLRSVRAAASQESS